jgi:hypothetical protein
MIKSSAFGVMTIDGRTYTSAIIIAIILAIVHPAQAVDIAGTWTKTTHPDPDNIMVCYTEAGVIKAIGFEQAGDAPAFWYGEGKTGNGRVEIAYRYSAEGTPSGWEPEGRMRLTLSEDGQALNGTATSKSGTWSARIELRRIAVVMQR